MRTNTTLEFLITIGILISYKILPPTLFLMVILIMNTMKHITRHVENQRLVRIQSTNKEYQWHYKENKKNTITTVHKQQTGKFSWYLFMHI